MKLTYNQIISAANGIIRTEENDLGLELHRFSRDQEGFFYKTHPVYCKESFFNGYFARNCRTCTGVFLDFITDAKTLTFTFAKIEHDNYKRRQVFDLYVDDVLAQSYKLDNELVYTSSGGQHRFTLYFPFFAFPTVKAVELEDATVFLPQKKPIEILFLGDSITHGVRTVHPSYTYVTRVARNLDIGVLNQGNSGFVYDAGSIEKVCDPKLVVTAYGINDFMRKDLARLENDTEQYLRKLREVYKDAKIVSILPLWTVYDGQDANFKSAERACLRRLYGQYSHYTIDGHSLMPHYKKYLADNAHPNELGFAFYGENLTKELKRIITQL